MAVKRSKRQPNVEFVVNGDYVTMTFSQWMKGSKTWHEEQYMFHVDYLEEIKDLKFPKSLSKFHNTHLTYANMIEFRFEVIENNYKVTKTKNLNEVCNYIAVRDNDYLVVPKGSYNSYAIDEHSTQINTLEQALELLESLE